MKSISSSKLNTGIIVLLITSIIIVFFFSCKKEVKGTTEVSYNELSILYKKASHKIDSLKKIKQKREIKMMSSTNTGSSRYDTMVSTILTEEEAQEILTPLMNPTVTYLQQNYDIDLNDYFLPNDPNIAIVGCAALRMDALEQSNEYIDTNNISLIPINQGSGVISYNVVLNELNTVKSSTSSSTFSLDEDKSWFDCAIYAIGIEAVVKFFDGQISSASKLMIKKKAIRKIITKVATRTLGVIGAAVAVYEFGDCMEWW